MMQNSSLAPLKYNTNTDDLTLTSKSNDQLQISLFVQWKKFSNISGGWTRKPPP